MNALTLVYIGLLAAVLTFVWLAYVALPPAEARLRDCWPSLLISVGCSVFALASALLLAYGRMSDVAARAQAPAPRIEHTELVCDDPFNPSRCDRRAVVVCHANAEVEYPTPTPADPYTREVHKDCYLGDFHGRPAVVRMVD